VPLRGVVVRDVPQGPGVDSFNQLRAILVHADPQLRESMAGLGPATLIRRCADLPESEADDIHTAATGVLRTLARSAWMDVMCALLRPNPQYGTRGSGMILTFFGTVWWLVGSVVLDDSARTAALVAGAVLAATLLVLAARRLDGTGGREAYERSARTFKWSNVGQGVGIAVVIAVGNITGGYSWIPALIAIVVGAHFFPLARPFGRLEYRWTGSLLIVVGVAGCAMAFSGASESGVQTVAGLGSATVLWATTAWYLVSGVPDRSTPRQQSADTGS
jgi:hypothetical protein